MCKNGDKITVYRFVLHDPLMERTLFIHFFYHTMYLMRMSEKWRCSDKGSSIHLSIHPTIQLSITPPSAPFHPSVQSPFFLSDLLVDLQVSGLRFRFWSKCVVTSVKLRWNLKSCPSRQNNPLTAL